MNMFNNKLNLMLNKRSNARSGPIPHGDPPEMKIIKHNRFFNFNKSLEYIYSGSTKEYSINLKHNYARGASGAVKLMLKYGVLYFYLPMFALIMLKCYSQDSYGYYGKKLVLKGRIEPPGGVQNMVNATRNDPYANDFLGRRTNFYEHSFVNIDLNKVIKNRFLDGECLPPKKI